MTAPLTRLAARLAPPNPDGELLTRFVRDRDRSAFAAIVGRHGPTVLGVCRRVLGNTADADDAFQAVFLVLVHRADVLARRPALGDWLYAAAVRVALKARTAFARRRKHERLAADRRPELTTDPPPAESWLDRELSALPDKLRAPVVLCLIQERQRAEVAAELGIPEGTLASRLDAARKRLADRLARYRVPLIVTGLAVSVPAAVADAAVNRAADGAGELIHQLALEVSNEMTPNSKLPVLVLAGLLAVSVGGLLLAMPADKPAAKPTTAEPPKKATDWKEEFDKVYTLKEGELVKIIPRNEWPASRKEFLKAWPYADFSPPEKKVKILEERYSFVFEIDAKGKRVREWDHGGVWRGDEYLGVSFPGPFLAIRLGLFEQFEVQFERRKDSRPIDTGYLDNPDFILRSDAPREKLIPALDKELKDKLNAKFQVELKDMEREVWVASGKLDFKPREWRKAGEVDVYSDEAAVDKEVTYPRALPKHLPGIFSDRGGLKLFLRQLARSLETWVIWGEGDPPAKPVFSWVAHWQEDKTPAERRVHRDPAKVLPNVAEQTGLTFTKEKRKVPVLVVSERK
jgi:RNA polymerase sigma factor (sigma-70 family)